MLQVKEVLFLLCPPCAIWSGSQESCPPLLFRVRFKWRLQENRFFLVFGLIIHFMATTTKAKRCIFISRTPKCPGYRSIFNKSRRYRLFSFLLRSQFGPIWIPFSWLSEMQCNVTKKISPDQSPMTLPCSPTTPEPTSSPSRRAGWLRTASAGWSLLS